MKVSAEGCRLHQFIIWAKAFVYEEFNIKACTCALQIAQRSVVSRCKSETREQSGISSLLHSVGQQLSSGCQAAQRCVRNQSAGVESGGSLSCADWVLYMAIDAAG